jgi:hypothetical protein
MIKSRRMRLAGHVARMGETRNTYRILVGKPEGKRQLGGARRRRVDNINWIDVPQDRDQRRVLVNKIIKFRVL